MKLYIAEKPSLGRVIAGGLGGGRSGAGHIAGQGWCVTWCFGHLYGMKMPDDYNSKYKRWARPDLPIVPKRFELKPSPKAKEQLGIISRLLKQASSVVNAGDPDREGQLLVDEVLSELRWRGAVQRLWLPALDARTVENALRNLRSNQDYSGLCDAALARSRADWLVGLNMTRAYTLRAGHTLTVGRVQTPTLKLVVDRDAEIENFIPKDFFLLSLPLNHPAGHYRGLWQAHLSPKVLKSDNPDALVDEDRRCLNRALAEQVVKECSHQPGTVTRAQKQSKSEPPKLPYNLSDLQSEASRRFGFGAQKTLDLAQRLYETHKLISYPRTDCRYLSSGQLQETRDTFSALAATDPSFAPLLRGADLERRPRSFADAKVTAHTAMVPTTNRTGGAGGLGRDERSLYDLIRRRYVAQFYPDFTYDQLQVDTLVADEPFLTRARAITENGWRAIDGPKKSASEGEEVSGLLARIQKGDAVRAGEGKLDAKKTTPPPAYTEGTLIRAMANIARVVTDPAAKRLLRESSGIGTEATRASIIENLKKREFLIPKGKFLHSGPEARELIAKVSPALADPVITAQWEDRMREIEAGKSGLAPFLSGVTKWLGELVKHSDGVQFETRPQSKGARPQGKGGSRGKTNPPTPKMLKFARTLATRNGLKRLPNGVGKTFDACRAFIDAQLENDSGPRRSSGRR